MELRTAVNTQNGRDSKIADTEALCWCSCLTYLRFRANKLTIHARLSRKRVNRHNLGIKL